MITKEQIEIGREQISVVNNTKPKSRLIITPDFTIRTRQPIPGRWHRFWYRVLLGWEWEALE